MPRRAMESRANYLFNHAHCRTLDNPPPRAPSLAERVRWAEEGRFPVHRGGFRDHNPDPWSKDYLAHPAVYRAAATCALQEFPTMVTVRDIFGSENCPVSMLRNYKAYTHHLSERWQEYAAFAVACNARTPESTLRTFLKSDSQIQRNWLAFSEHTRKFMQWELANDPDSRVRETLAENSIHEDILDHLSKDRETRVRTEVARNCHTGKATLRRLTTDPKPMVRAKALANKRTPLRDVRKAAQTETSAAPLTAALARLGTSEQAVVERAATHTSPQARTVAAARLANPDMLNSLAWDPNRRVREATARNAAASAEARVAVYLQDA